MLKSVNDQRPKLSLTFNARLKIQTLNELFPTSPALPFVTTLVTFKQLQNR